MDRNYLLTYIKNKVHHYEWFETQEEMQGFVDSNDIDEIIDSLHIFGITEVPLDKN